jgi:hypothetical protein
METQFFLPYSLHHTHPYSPINPSNKGRGEGTDHDRVDKNWTDGYCGGCGIRTLVVDGLEDRGTFLYPAG